ncbi:MAG: metalloregulator ArsR/SmtB family transcription factor [Alphaproteobacteria bacterium]|nr:metalloregulator ArsR/SmtB family transcription factor [Alphaproteobacteria bacterium]
MDDVAVRRLAALAQGTRVKIFKALMRAGPDGLAAGVLAERLEVAPNTLSAHLSVLSEADLVSARREGRMRIYAVELEAVSQLLSFLVDDCCQGNPEVCAPIAARSAMSGC